MAVITELTLIKEGGQEKRNPYIKAKSIWRSVRMTAEATFLLLKWSE